MLNRSPHLVVIATSNHAMAIGVATVDILAAGVIPDRATHIMVGRGSLGGIFMTVRYTVGGVNQEMMATSNPSAAAPPPGILPIVRQATAILIGRSATGAADTYSVFYMA